MQLKNHKFPKNTILLLIISVIISFTVFFPNLDISNLSEIDINNSQLPYQPLNEDGIMPIGNITVISIEGMAIGTIVDEIADPIYGMAYPHNIDYEYLTEFPSAFIGVQQIADEEVYFYDTKEGSILLTINESVRYDYWYNDSRTITYFKSELSKSAFSGISNVTINGTEIDFWNNSIFKVENNGFILNYSTFRSDDEYPNGTLIVGYEIDYLFSINEWRMMQIDMYQDDNRPVYLDENSSLNMVKYNYTFGTGGARAENLRLNLTLKINLPDADYLNFHSITNYTGEITDPDATIFNDYILNPDKSVEISMDLSNYSIYSINTEAEFTLEFDDVYTSFWNKDYLSTDRQIRERQYKITCVDGPPSLAASFFSFNITSIPYEDLISASSEFIRNGAQERSISLGNMSEFNAEDGITVFSYEGQNSQQYKLFTGETDLITIRYRSWRTLNLIITDQINIPISGVSVRIIYQNVTYGTLMSAGKTNQIPVKISDLNGQIQIPNMPAGIFNISIYHNGDLIQNSLASTLVEMNRINTSIPHFPTTVLIFLLTSVVVTGIGFYIYRKNQN